MRFFGMLETQRRSHKVMRTVKHIATTLAKGFASDEQVDWWLVLNITNI